MSARTDKIAELEARVERLLAAGKPNKASVIRQGLQNIAAMSDQYYDTWMAAMREAAAKNTTPAGFQK